jgi:uncharacterized oligopeptide transporter (OPT) family protein
MNSDNPTQIPVLSPDATPEEKDMHWLKYVYRGDSEKQLTVRAVFTGGIIGMAMSLSHLYTSLKLGWGFGVAITACVMSYVAWNGLARLRGGKMTPLSMLENNCMQSTASAAGYSTGATVASACAALLLVTGQHIPWYHLAPFVFFTAMLGVFIAIPMKRQMINHEELPFPSGIAAAETLRTLYTKGAEALAKARALVLSLGVGAAIGILRGWQLLSDTLKEIGRESPALSMITSKLYIVDSIAIRLAPVPGKTLAGLSFEPSGMLIAAGMMIGLRVALSMLAGSAIIYFILVPWLWSMDSANAGVAGYVPSLTVKGDTINPTRWSLWAGTAVMVMSSLASLGLQWRTVARAFTIKRSSATSEAMSRVEVPSKWFVRGTIISAIGLIISLKVAFNIGIFLGIVAVLMSFVIALVSCRATGETDTTPNGPMGKVVQLVYAILPGAAGNTIINLMSAGTTSSAGMASADLLTDLKSGHLLGASPRKQFLAQFFGVFFGTLAIVPAWYLMVPDKAGLEKYPAIAANMWKAVADLLTQGIHMLPQTALGAIVVGGIIGVLIPLLQKFVPKAGKFLPSAMGLGLGIALPFQNSLSFAIGAIVAAVWAKVDAKRAEGFTVPIASGLIAGEALLGALIAIACTILGLAHKAGYL